MTAEAVEALRTEVEHVKAVLDDLDEETWSLASGCEGWTIKDLVAHLASDFDAVLNPGSGPPAEGDEPFTEPAVRASRGSSVAEVRARYESLAAAGCDALAGLQEPPMADVEVPIATLGTYPLHLVANALAFDHWCHLRVDLARPRGPLDIDVPANDDAVAATVEWLLAGLPQMNASRLNPAVTRPVVLELTGPGGGTWSLVPADGGFTVQAGAVDDAVAVVRSTTTDFVVWSTQRAPWRDSATVTGDVDFASAVLDLVNLE